MTLVVALKKFALAKFVLKSEIQGKHLHRHQTLLSAFGDLT